MELFCIKHEKMEKAQVLFDTVKITHPDGDEEGVRSDEKAIQIGYIHEVITYPTFDNPSGNFDWCGFEQGWATVPPPEMQPYEDWPFGIHDEPSPEELEAINLEAENLLADMEWTMR